MADGYRSDSSRSNIQRGVFDTLKKVPQPSSHRKVSSSSSSSHTTPPPLIDDSGDDVASQHSSILHSDFDSCDGSLLQSTKPYLPRFASPQQTNHDNSIDADNLSEDSLEIEMGRGGAADGGDVSKLNHASASFLLSTRNTPSRPNARIASSDIMYGLMSSNPATPLAHATTRPRKLNTVVAERSNLRKELAHRRVSKHVVVDEENKENQAPRLPLRSAVATAAGITPARNSTQNSFAIPDVTNVSELFAQSTGKISRPQNAIRRAQSNYIPVSSAPISDADLVLMEQLQALKAKVAALEQQNYTRQAEVGAYQVKVAELHAELQDRDREDEQQRGMHHQQHTLDLAVLRSRAENSDRHKLGLEAQLQEKERELQRLRRRLDRAANTNNQTREVITDAELLRKAAAFESENSVLRDTIDDLNQLVSDLQAQLDDTRDHHDEETQNWTQRVARAERAIVENHDLKEQLSAAKAEYEREVKRIRREADSRKIAAEAAKALHSKLQAEHEKLLTELAQARTKVFAKTRPGDVVGQELVNEELRQYNEELRLELDRFKSDNRRDVKRDTAAVRSRSKSNTQRHMVDDGEETKNTRDLSDVALPESKVEHDTPVVVVEADTLLSVVPPEVIREHRRIIEQERLNAKHRRAVSATEVKKMPQKSCLASATGRATDNISVRSIRSTTGKDQQQQPHRRKRPSQMDSDMTSALLLQDFTLAGAKILNPKPDTCSTTAVKEIHTPHDPHRCTVCYRTIHPGTVPENVQIPKPVPVSSSSSDDDVDATSRPSESPHNALARCIKVVADEIVHFKMELRATHKRLVAFDGSRGSRERQGLHEQLDLVNRNLSSKNALLYSLYDVLEGVGGAVTGVDDVMATTASLGDANQQQQQQLEDEMQDATEEAQSIIASLKAARRVTIQSPNGGHHTARPVTENNITNTSSRAPGLRATAVSISDETGELPWEGFVTETTTGL